MSTRTVNFVIDGQNVRVFPFASQGQISSSNPGTLQGAGHTSVGADGVTYQDDNTFGRRLLQVSSALGPPSGATVFDASAIYARGAVNIVDDTIIIPCRWCDIAVMANQACELRLYFATVLPVSPDASTSHGTFAPGANAFNLFAQVQDMPPLFVPSDLTKWTVWRRVEITDRFFIPVLFNLSAGIVSLYRMNTVFYDAQR